MKTLNRMNYLALLLGALLASSIAARAQSVWQGGTSTDWQSASNWTLGVPDTAGEYASFNYVNVPGDPILLGGDVTLGATTSATSDSLSLVNNNPAKSLTISGYTGGTNNTLTLNATSYGKAHFLVDGTSNNAAPVVTFENMNLALNTTGTGVLSVDGGATVNIANTVALSTTGGGGLTVRGVRTGDAQGVINLNAASFNAGGNGKVLNIETGTVNWGVASFTTSGATPKVSVIGAALNDPATLRFTKSYSSGKSNNNLSGGTVEVGSSTSSYSAKLVVEDQVTLGEDVQILSGATTAGTSSAVIGVTAQNATGTFAGVVGISQPNATVNTMTVSFTAATNSTAVFNTVRGYRGGGITTGPWVFEKTGKGTVIFAGSKTSTYGNGYRIASGQAFDIKEGRVILANTSFSNEGLMDTGSIVRTDAILELGASNQIADTATLTLEGGAQFVANTFSESLGTLNVTGVGAILTLGVNASIAFADSHLLTWTGTLNVTGIVDSDALRIGLNASGLSADQLSRISINGMGAQIDSLGYLSAVPEPTASALLIASVFTCVFAARRKRE